MTNNKIIMKICNVYILFMYTLHKICSFYIVRISGNVFYIVLIFNIFVCYIVNLFNKIIIFYTKYGIRSGKM